MGLENATEINGIALKTDLCSLSL